MTQKQDKMADKQYIVEFYFLLMHDAAIFETELGVAEGSSKFLSRSSDFRGRSRWNFWLWPFEIATAEFKWNTALFMDLYFYFVPENEIIHFETICKQIPYDDVITFSGLFILSPPLYSSSYR